MNEQVLPQGSIGTIDQEAFYKEISSLIESGKEDGKDPLRKSIPQVMESLQGERIGPSGLEHIIHVEGDIPIIFTCPHGGYKDVELDLAEREKGGFDKRSKEFTLFLAHAMKQFLGVTPHVLINEVPRRYIDLNRGPTDYQLEAIDDNRIRGYRELISDTLGRPATPDSSVPFSDPSLTQYFEFYHGKIIDTMEDVIQKDGSGLHIAWHTFRSRDPGKYNVRDIYKFKNGLEDYDSDHPIVPLPPRIQQQVNCPIIFGTHLRSTVDHDRGIDTILQQAYISPHGTPDGLQAFVPSSDDEETVLGGQYEILHGSLFKTKKAHPIDAIQIEINKNTYLNSFEHVLYHSVLALQKGLAHYTTSD